MTDVDDEFEVGTTDSGYTRDELDAIFESLANGKELPNSFELGMIIGLWDSCLLPLADETTAWLRTPRPELDHRVATVRAAIAGGATLRQAVEMLEQQDADVNASRNA
jgi:hypothetical protein